MSDEMTERDEARARCELCEQTVRIGMDGGRVVLLPREHSPECKTRLPNDWEAWAAARLRAAADRLIREGIVVHQTHPASQRRGDIQRGARAAARLAREFAATWPTDLAAPQNARDAREFAERIAQHIEASFTDAAIALRVAKAIDEAILGEFDDARIEPEGTRR